MKTSTTHLSRTAEHVVFLLTLLACTLLVGATAFA